MAAIQDNLPSLAFKLFAAFAKTWLFTQNRISTYHLVIHESTQGRNNNDTVCFKLCTRFGEFTRNKWCNLENLAAIARRKVNENIFPRQEVKESVYLFRV